MTIRQALTVATNLLRGVSDAPDLDAQWLLLHVLQKNETSWLLTRADDTLTSNQSRRFLRSALQRASGKPLAYILGRWDFYGRHFLVNEHVLVPRPSTESLIDEASRYIIRVSSRIRRPLVIADIGTGSGCIAVTLLLEQLPLRHVVATDVSRAALAVARRNAEQYGVSGRITFLQGDLLAPLKDWRPDLIVSNPPYVPTFELAAARSNSVTQGLAFEPLRALDGGDDGLVFVRKLCRAGIPAVIETRAGSIVTVP